MEDVEVKLATIQKLELKEGDVLLITFNEPLRVSAWKYATKYFGELKEKLPFKNEIMIADNINSVSVLTKG